MSLAIKGQSGKHLGLKKVRVVCSKPGSALGLAALHTHPTTVLHCTFTSL